MSVLYHDDSLSSEIVLTILQFTKNTTFKTVLVTAEIKANPEFTKVTPKGEVGLSPIKVLLLTGSGSSNCG
jgi:hypothetical protein